MTLDEYRIKYPKLTLDNDGYQYLDIDTLEEHFEVLCEIDKLCSKCIKGFKRFNNFKPRKDGSFDVRVQYDWSYGNPKTENSFIGVGYFNITELDEYLKNNNDDTREIL